MSSSTGAPLSRHGRGEVIGREHVADVDLPDRGLRHARYLRISWLLDDGDPALPFDAPQAEDAVAAPPDRITPMTRGLYAAAAVLNRGSMAGRKRFSRGPRVRRAWPDSIGGWWSGGATWIRPGPISSPSTGCPAGSAPALASTTERTPGPFGAVWMTTKIAAGNRTGKPRSTLRNAASAPVDPPMTMMSRLCTEPFSHQDMAGPAQLRVSGTGYAAAGRVP